MSDYRPPSDELRELVRGAFDLHIHIGPDVVERRIDDVSLARRFEEVGLAGYVLKSHYTSTAERAAVVRGVVPGIRAMGALSLNRAVGGMNPLAIDIAGREGAHTVWMPTVDAENESIGRSEPQPGENVPVWAKLQRELIADGVELPAVPVVDADGAVLPETRECLRMIAKHAMVLATGHLSTAEIFAVVDAANEEGVADIVITHPDYPAQNISIEDQLELAGKGALLERCFVQPYTGKCSWERWLEGTKAVGPGHTLLSTDLGQIKNPPVEDGLPLLAEKLLEAGFSEEEVRTMAVENTRRLAGAVAA
jgi:hypothetical protein